MAAIYEFAGYLNEMASWKSVMYISFNDNLPN